MLLRFFLHLFLVEHVALPVHVDYLVGEGLQRSTDAAYQCVDFRIGALAVVLVSGIVEHAGKVGLADEVVVLGCDVLQDE